MPTNRRGTTVRCPPAPKEDQQAQGFPPLVDQVNWRSSVLTVPAGWVSLKFRLAVLPTSLALFGCVLGILEHTLTVIKSVK